MLPKFQKKIHVVVFSPYYYPDFGPSVPIFTTLCEDLVTLGYEVTVITTFPHYCESSPQLHRSGKIINKDFRNGVTILRTYVWLVPKRQVWQRLIYHASLNIFSTLASVSSNRPDLIIAGHPVLWSGLPLIAGSFLQRIPYIYLVYDIYPDVLVRLGIVKNRFFIGFLNSVEKVFFSQSARISVLSEGFKKNLISKGIPANKIKTIPVCIDTDFIRPLPKHNRLSKQWAVEDKFVVLYAGNIGFSQGIETILRAANLLRRNKRIQFVIVGDGAKREQVEQKIAAEDFDNVLLLPFQPSTDVPLVYACADVSLVTLNRDIAVESVPSKTYSIMASGRPVIAAVESKSEITNLIKKSGCGVCIEPDEPVRLANEITKFYEGIHNSAEMGANGRAHVEKFYSRKIASSSYHQTIREILSQK